MTVTTDGIQFRTHIHRLERLNNMTYLEIPKEVVEQLGSLKMRLLCTVNGSLTFQCGLMALGEGRAYISINAARLKKLGLKFGDEAAVMLQKDRSKYGVEVCEEFAELLRQDDEGNRRFHLLSPGMQRYIINHAGSVKSSQLRIDRSISMLENLKRLPEGKEEFRDILGVKK
ncbi:YdeI/OmpD-associated family protein [Cesiribacter sp. SM1]|uniref:DUF1905 domain-containing protein n=1 Tax=Cesiribacter sp. SM1 TaxID=2861196 RepID=UPI001CD6D805|nr:YdeI/OmpD-associated family protein [Cesiribacter sp. SM1]